jgi:hypothetical protein
VEQCGERRDRLLRGSRDGFADSVVVVGEGLTSRARAERLSPTRVQPLGGFDGPEPTTALANPGLPPSVKKEPRSAQS